MKERERDINANVMERVSEGDEKRARTQETRLTDYSCFFALPNSTIDAVFTHTHPPIHAHTRTQRHTHTDTHAGAQCRIALFVCFFIVNQRFGCDGERVHESKGRSQIDGVVDLLDV